MGAAKNILIGIFAVIALAIIIFVLLFLHPSVGDNRKVLHVRFTDIDKVNIGTRVTLAGHPVGEVTEIKEISEARTSRQPYQGYIYVYELTLRVDSSVIVFDTDEISLRTSGLLGERNIDIVPHPPENNETTIYSVDKDIIYAVPSGSVEETVRLVGDLSKKFNAVLEELHITVKEINDEKVVKNVGITAKNLADITTALNKPEKLSKTIDNVFKLSDSLVELSDRIHHTWTNVDTTVNHFNEMSKKADEIVAYAREGKGSVGRIFMTDDLYLNLKALLSKGETIFNDVNHYGILFHLSKDWQRINARRLNLLGRLASPDQFSTYFNDELDKISTSLSRVSMVLGEADYSYPNGLLTNPDYIQKFGELLRRIEGVEESLKMYNQQVVDQSVNTNNSKGINQLPNCPQ